MSARYTKSNFSNQTGTGYMAAVDANAEVCFRTAAAFTPSQAETPDMTVRVEAGALLSGSTLTEVAAQNTGTITAPTVASRIDRVVISRATGAVSVITGVESCSSSAPALTADVLPVAQVALSVGQTSITNADITDERICGAGAGDMLRANNLSDVVDVASARTNLGLGTAAVLNVGTSASNVVQMDADAKLPAVDGSQLTGLSTSQVSGLSSYMQKANNLSDVADVASARTNLGLGSAAVLNVGTSASNVVQMGADAKLPAVDGSKLTGLTSAQVSGLSGFMPTGAIIAMACETAPSSFLECNGTAVSRTTYAALFAVIGTRHGYGDNATTFNLPDYRGRFLRGWDHAIARDPDRASRTAMNTGGATGDAVGSVQIEALKSHLHGILNASGPGFAAMPYAARSGGESNGSPDGWTTQSTGGNETRPINANVMYCIKC